MSEQNKTDDPFAGLDWDAELENWDQSTRAPGGAAVPDSFSKAAPVSSPTQEPQASRPAQAAPHPEASTQSNAAAPEPPKAAKPLYRPPSGSVRPSTANAPAFRPPPGGLKPSSAQAPSMPPPKRAVELPSIIDDDDDVAHDSLTRAAPSSEAGYGRGDELESVPAEEAASRDAPEPEAKIEFDLDGFGEVPDEPAAAPSAPKLDPDATVEASDPFATRDPFAEVDEGEIAMVEADDLEAAGIIDLLHADDVTGAELPPVSAFSGGGKPASEWVRQDAKAWLERAERAANDARQLEKGPRARGLVVASELAAIAGDRPKAIELAEEAWNESPNEPLAVRQLRQLFATEGRWEEVAPFLEGEAKAGPSAHARAHAALLGADIARIARGAPDEAERLYELAQRAVSDDLRPAIARAVAALAHGKKLPNLSWSDSTGAGPLAEAIERRARDGEPAEDTALAVVLEGVGGFAEGQPLDADVTRALGQLGDSESLAGAAAWLRFALRAARTETRAAARDDLASLPATRARVEADLALSLDLGEVDRGRETAAGLARENPSSERLVVSQLLDAVGGSRPSANALTPALATSGVASVARGAALAANEDTPPELGAVDSLEASARVARRLSKGGSIDLPLREATSRGAQLGFALGDALGAANAKARLDALAPLLSQEDATLAEALTRLLAALADHDVSAAVDAAEAASRLDPSSFPAALAQLGLGAPDAEAAALAAAVGTPHEGRGTAFAIRVAIAALRRDDLDTAHRASDVARGGELDDGVMAFLSELRARRAGDFDGLIEAVRARAASVSDPAARAAHLVREIFLVMGTDLATSIERSQEAASLLPADATLRALYERIAGEGAQGRAAWRTALAETLEGEAKAETLLDAAHEAELHGDLDAAARLAAAAEAAGCGAEATELRRRVLARGDGAARLAEELLEAAKAATEPALQRELYEALADLDLSTRGDAASAIMWHQAILEASPEHLPSLRRLEHMLISLGREDDYEPLASQLARVLREDGRDAHAEVAARLRLRRPEAAWDSIGDLVAAAAQRQNPSLWATRMLDALARSRGDDDARLRALELLLARTERTHERAALATRAAEVAFRSGDAARARTYLEGALEADPHHPTALASLAELRRAAGEFQGAAEALEAMAQAGRVAAHQLEDWHAAAMLWLDQVGDDARGRAALERAAEIELGYADVFERLVALARKSADRQLLGDLYERRLQQVEGVAEQAQLHVDHARLLIDLDDPDAARQALSQALERVPTHAEALELGLRLAEHASDWPEVERLLLQLSELPVEPDERARIHRRLGELYEAHLPDPSRAEVVYRRVLEHDDGDDAIRAKLVTLYVELRDADRAIETHQERVRRATDGDRRRTLLLELAHLLDDVAGDAERALGALEQARATDPSDLESLTALAEFHYKHGRPEAVAAALDAAIDQVRAKIAAAPGALDDLAQLTKLFELRGRPDAARVVRAAMAGLAGEPCELIGAEDGAAVPEVDPLLCPPELTPALRAFLERAGEAIEKSVPVDLRALKAAKLGPNQPALKATIDAVAHGFGLPDADVVLSRAMPFLCLPVGAKPFQIVIGEGIATTADDAARRFALARTMKLCAARGAALVRVPASDLRTYLDALLHHLHSESPAPPVDAERLDELTRRLQRFIPKKDEPELKQLASALAAEGPIDVDRIASAAATWGDRTALLATGDLAAALTGVAWSLGQQEVPREPSALQAWLVANPAARDMLLFAVSDAYVEARRVAGVGG